MYRYPFAVYDRTYCVWEYDLPARNARFLENIDASYFGYLATLHLGQLRDESRQHAAVALRAGYHHGLETLFSLLGALTQAPECVPAWLPKCSNTSLRSLVAAIQAGRPVLTQCGLQVVSLAALSQVVHQYVWQEEDPPGETARRFARLWERFAEDLLDQLHVAEYNSLKHGFRVASGGFSLSVGREHEYGVAPPLAEMRSLGGSRYGTSFFAPEPVSTSGRRDDRSFRVRRHSLNWSAEAMAQRLLLIEFSVGNVVGALRCLTGSPPSTVRFSRPEDATAFDRPWNYPIGITSSNMDTTIEPTDVSETGERELRAELESRSRAV